MQLLLVFLCVFERTMNAIFCLIFKSSGMKQQAAQQVIVKQVEFWTGFLMSWVNVRRALCHVPVIVVGNFIGGLFDSIRGSGDL